ncbi:ATPase and nucleosome spacing factor [Komagataella phaffii CBS 7435]|uniref:Chromatin-remodeling ATPase INO80 n=2 Tax=Komagataella phaffii TaxID=460519 RepID=C4QW24_KOMPG|nr:uncharacterized protein PAS_chr1-1_0087 [Komagataella phaffii GS115]AOA61747.1 GQ67_02656T0 [Komagataella phaffii]CAH2446113.1 ATPase and nucleosome spacing factor [Komagataella phaffii CBS 7435]AOA66833.1 GQ68_02592T0 [Komagataella phaffii GS115]CAY67447.1 ATPase that forms a large complex, containing actin and several actin-related proteins [Komagataella phaffii GS115]CCA36546.1 ATPase and nucleosome spacing factor [Komagataella phaffii CBS 7435]
MASNDSTEVPHRNKSSISMLLNESSDTPPPSYLEAFENRVASLVALDGLATQDSNMLKYLYNELALVREQDLKSEATLISKIKDNLLEFDPNIAEKLIKRATGANHDQVDEEIEPIDDGTTTEITNAKSKRGAAHSKADTEAPAKPKSRRRKNISASADSEDKPKGKGAQKQDNSKNGKSHNGDEELTNQGWDEDEIPDENSHPPRKRRTAASTNAEEGRPKRRRKAAIMASSKARELQEDPAAFEEEDSPKRSNVSVKEQKSIDKQYDNTYMSIWRDLSRKDGPRNYRLFQTYTQTKAINLKKTALLAAREARRWQIRTNKSQKDLQTKARRSMREMLNFWKKNEREERELRKKAEKEALDSARKEEEDREAKRQSRKLNFLLTQTELYSHFIGNKIKTDELEGNMGDKALTPSNGTDRSHLEGIDLSHAKADFNNIDFDQLNDENLEQTAAANAQSALQETQRKAQAFNNVDPDEEMNFQNPTSLGEITITQPKLLNCTLKEYQVKGLNWLANLYDQGINGILADEMGLGKTVQSISVLAYLAETHNIWGPFLVVTPSSTLHNWQQEISKFLPDFKVLPYWGSAKDRKVLRKFWDRKNIIYNKNSPFHVLVTSYQLVVQDAQYFQKVKWQYMILDEAQAIKSSQSSRWKVLLSFQCRNRLLLTGTPIQNSMQELWALLHFIMPSLFDSHDEFSEWFSKDIESHAQSNTQLNEQQLKRLHMILKPFMLRRIKKNVQSELGDKIEIDVYCKLTNRQKKLYRTLKSQISLIDLMDNKFFANNNSTESDSLMNLVMQFRKVCNHPDLFERADTKSAFHFGTFSDTASFSRENLLPVLDVFYSSANVINYRLPTLLYDEILSPNFEDNAQFLKQHLLYNGKLNIWNAKHLHRDEFKDHGWLSLLELTPDQVVRKAKQTLWQNLLDESDRFEAEQELRPLYSIQRAVHQDMYINTLDPAAFPLASAPPIEVSCSRQSFNFKRTDSLFNAKFMKSLFPLSLNEEYDLLVKKVEPKNYPPSNLYPKPVNNLIGYSSIRLPSMERFVIESGKLAKLDKMLVRLKKEGHKVLVYFQMTKMMDLMEEFLTYRQYKYIRLDGSSKLSDRRDLVHDWQTKPELFVFLLSTRAGGLGINLTAADTVIFYDSDWNPTIDSQAMDRAHRLGQTRQVTVYRLLVRGTIEEKMRNRAKQKEHVQQVVMEGKSGNNPAFDDKKDKREVAMMLMGSDDELNTSADEVVVSSTVA